MSKSEEKQTMGDNPGEREIHFKIMISFILLTNLLEYCRRLFVRCIGDDD